MVTQERTKTGILRAIRTLATHHLQLVAKKLLAADLPQASHIVETWHTLATDESLAKSIVEGRLPTAWEGTFSGPIDRL
jgi:hypothetical protein